MKNSSHQLESRLNFLSLIPSYLIVIFVANSLTLTKTINLIDKQLLILIERNTSQNTEKEQIIKFINSYFIFCLAKIQLVV